FITGNQLKVHVKVHITGKPYHCDVFNKQFITENQLKVHVKVHITDKPTTVIIVKRIHY
ncbi:hypothetical protein LOTGIDRAFT_104153, partial [Lottia gigantea]